MGIFNWFKRKPRKCDLLLDKLEFCALVALCYQNNGELEIKFPKELDNMLLNLNLKFEWSADGDNLRKIKIKLNKPDQIAWTYCEDGRVI
jgi:hypothetical protein